MKITRRKSKTIKIGNVSIGGNNPIAIQSMTKTETRDIEETVRQIQELESAGCQIVRLAVKDSLDALALKKIKQKVKLPIVADIHFNWQLALQAIDSGVDKIRLNPGNIYKKEQIREIASAAKLNRIPIRVGINSGSVKRNTSSFVKASEDSPPKFQRRRTPYAMRPPAGRAGNTTADIMVKNTLDYIKILEGFKFYDIVISLKASSVSDTVEAYRKMAKLCGYPMHLGVTATGLPLQGAVKSSIAIGALLLEGIGDTIRVSLTDKPEEEVRVARNILAALGLGCFGPEIISCPTCGRCEVDLVKIVQELEKKLYAMPACPAGRRYALYAPRPLKVAVMGCVVNGPGEAGEADIGVAFGRRQGLLFKKGKPLKKISSLACADILLKEIMKS